MVCVLLISVLQIWAAAYANFPSIQQGEHTYDQSRPISVINPIMYLNNYRISLIPRLWSRCPTLHWIYISHEDISPAQNRRLYAPFMSIKVPQKILFSILIEFRFPVLTRKIRIMKLASTFSAIFAVVLLALQAGATPSPECQIICPHNVTDTCCIHTSDWIS